MSMDNCIEYFEIRPVEGYPNGVEHAPNIWERWSYALIADVSFRCCRGSDSVDALPLYYELMLLDRWVLKGREREKYFDIGEGVLFHMTRGEQHITYTFFAGGPLSEPATDTPENIAAGAAVLRKRLKEELSKYFNLSDMLSAVSLSLSLIHI